MLESRVPRVTEDTAREIVRLVDQLERAFEGDAWHGPSISEILVSVSAEQAAAPSAAGAHSIWEIVLHMTAWQRAVRQRLEGESVHPLSDEEDWPRVGDPSTEAWVAAVRELRVEYERLRDTASSLAGEDLEQVVDGQRYTVYQLLHGVLQHGLYHAGQIAVLKRLAPGEGE